MVDWDSFGRHRRHVVKSTGQWIGVLDENGEPLFELPPPISINVPDTRLSPSSMKIVIPVKDDRGRIHPIVDDLVGDRIGKLDNGKFVPSNGATRIVVVERDGGKRVAGWIPFVEAEGGWESPTTLTINAVTMIDYLNCLPCPASKKSWREAKYQKLDRDPVGLLNTKRDVALLTFADSADGFSEQGEAEPLIRQIITESVEVLSAMEGWEKPHIVVDQTASGYTTPKVTLRITDDSIWETVADTATLAGVNIHADLWLPGDLPINGKEYTHPVILITVRGVNEQP